MAVRVPVRCPEGEEWDPLTGKCAPAALGATPVKCSLPDVRKIRTTTATFRGKLIEIAQRVEVNPDHLAAVIAFESGFDPAARNPHSGATGLIQFLRGEAVKFGTTTDALAQMSAEEQLDFVERYFRPYRGRLGTLCDTYYAVFAPICIGKPLDHVAYRGGTRAYEQNSAIDKDRSGSIECRDICGQITGILAAAGDRRVPAPCSADRVSIARSIVLPILGAALVAGGLWWWLR